MNCHVGYVLTASLKLLWNIHPIEQYRLAYVVRASNTKYYFKYF